MSKVAQSLRDEILSAGMWRLMAKLTPVSVLAMSINSINTFVDGLYIGQFLGENALAAVSLAFPLSFLSNSLAAMLGVGGSSVLSIAIGANDDSKQKKVFVSVAILSIICSILLAAIGYIFAEEMIAAIGGRGEILEMGASYFRILILASFFQIFSVSTNMLIRAEGKVNTAMSMGMIAVFVNMIANPIFLGYFDMGIEGAAYATVLSMVVFTLLDLRYFLRRRASYQVDLAYRKLEKSMVQPILQVGVSAMMLQLMFILHQIVVYKMIEQYGGDRDIAFMGACYRVMLLMLVPGFGFSTAMQPVAGINYGANQLTRVKRAFWTFASGSTLVTTTLLIIFVTSPRMVLQLMLPDLEITPDDIFNFRLMMSPGFIFPFFIVGMVMFQAIGSARTAGIVLVLREIVFFVPFVILLPQFFGLTGIYAAGIFQNTLVGLVAAYVLYRTFNQWSKKVA